MALHRRAKWTTRVPSWLQLSLLVAYFFMGSEAVVVADKAALITLRDNCLSLSVDGASSAPGDACDLFLNADVSAVNDMSHMFGASSFTGNIANWDVSAVNDMSYMFRLSSFTGNISKWNVSAVKDMSYMFASSTFNGNIANWDVSAVKYMNGMFYKSAFTGDISKWDVSAVNNMGSMFSNSPFTGNISKWDVSAVNDMGCMFCVSSFTGNISGWDVSSVTTMESMFESSAFTGDISKWDVSAVNDMHFMFYQSSFTGDLSKWDVSAVNDMSSMFQSDFVGRKTPFMGDISKWDVSAVSRMRYMFYQSSFTGNISKWNVSAVIDMSYMFRGSAFYGDLCAWNLGQRTSGPSMVQQDGMFVNSFLENSDFGCQPTCNDKEQNENETTVDCGGTYSCQTGCAVRISQPEVVSTTPPSNNTASVTPGCLVQFSPEDIDSLACAKAPVDSPNCQEERKWEQLYLEYERKGANPAFVTGGLGSLMTKDKFEAWVCLRGHPCLLEAGVNPAQGDRMCFVYDEGDRRFIPWDKQRNLNLV